MSHNNSSKTTSIQETDVTVYLSQEEATQFLVFRENYSNFVIMTESRVFDQKGAAITLHFDTNGVIRSITRADLLYKYGVDFQNTN